MKVILSLLFVLIPMTANASSEFQIRDAEGVIITSPTSGERFELTGVILADCEGNSGASSETAFFVCKATAGEVAVIDANGDRKVSAIDRVVITEVFGLRTNRTTIYKFRLNWDGNLAGYHWSSMAWLTLSNYETPAGELNGSFELKRFEHKFPIAARWRSIQ